MACRRSLSRCKVEVLLVADAFSRSRLDITLARRLKSLSLDEPLMPDLPVFFLASVVVVAVVDSLFWPGVRLTRPLVFPVEAGAILLRVVVVATEEADEAGGCNEARLFEGATLLRREEEMEVEEEKEEKEAEATSGTLPLLVVTLPEGLEDRRLVLVGLRKEAAFF